MLEEISTHAESHAEVVTQTELERQEAEALRLLLLAASAALSLAVKGYRVKLSDSDWSELRSDVVLAAIERGRVKDAERGQGGGIVALSRTERRMAAEWMAAGTPAADLAAERRISLHLAKVADLAAMPRRNDLAGEGGDVSYLAGVARNLIKAHLTRTDRAEDMPEDAEDAGRWQTDVSAEDFHPRSKREMVTLRHSLED
jgi:hypothetical protein